MSALKKKAMSQIPRFHFKHSTHVSKIRVFLTCQLKFPKSLQSWLTLIKSRSRKDSLYSENSSDYNDRLKLWMAVESSIIVGNTQADSCLF